MVLLDCLMRTRCRIVVFALSVVGLLTVCSCLLLRPSPAITVSMAPTTHHQKVSVILCTPHGSVEQVLQAHDSITKALDKIKLQHEFYVVSLRLSLRSPGSHASLDPSHILSYTKSCAESAYYAVRHSHYSVVLYLSSNVTSYKSVIPELVRPVLRGDSDLVLLKDSSSLSPSLWQRIMHLLLLPITGSTHISDTPSFAISSSVWFHGCHGINSGRGSLTIDMVARCLLRNWREVEGETTPPYEEPSLVLTQVLDLWWDCHPLVCIAVVMVTSLTVITLVIKYRLKTTNNFTRVTDLII